MTRREEIAIELNRLAKVAVGIQLRYQAFMTLHAAASANCDEQELTQRRDELHTVLDALLDNGEAVDRLKSVLETIP